MFIIIDNIAIRTDLIISAEKLDSIIFITMINDRIIDIQDKTGQIWEYILTMLPCEKSFDDFNSRFPKPQTVLL